MRVAIALDHLRRDARGLQPQLRQRLFFDLRRQMRERSDRAGELSRRASFRRLPGSARSCRRISSYQSASFSPNVVGSAWMPCVRPTATVVLNSCARFFRTSSKPRDARGDDLGGVDHLQGHGRVEHIRRGQAEVKVARGRSDELRDRCREGDDVVLRFQLDLVDAIDGEIRLGFDFGGGVFGNDALRGERFRDGEFDVEPALVFVLVFPDPAHRRTCVARYHPKSLTEPNRRRRVLLARCRDGGR